MFDILLIQAGGDVSQHACPIVMDDDESAVFSGKVDFNVLIR